MAQLYKDKKIHASLDAMRHVRETLIENDSKTIGEADLKKHGAYLRELVARKMAIEQ